MKYSLKMDYVTMNFSDMTPSRVADRLTGDVDFAWRCVSTPEAGWLQSPTGLFWKPNNGFSDRPYTLQVSGVGCTHFIESLPALRYASKDSEFCHISRIDFAFDVIMSKSDWVDYITGAFYHSLTNDRKAKKYKLEGSGEAMTVYIGARRSPYYFRIYNKSLQDSFYTYVDGDGNEIPLSDDEYVIRYEVEYKRFTRTRSGEKEIYNPSPLFDMYYEIGHENTELFDKIRKDWLSYGDESILPEDFENAEFCVYRTSVVNDLNKTENFVQSGEVPEAVYIAIRESLHDYPHTFDRSLSFVVERYGKYLPYILNDKLLYEECMTRARVAFGWDLAFSVCLDLGDPDFCAVDMTTPWDDDPDIYENVIFGGFDYKSVKHAF